MAWTEEEERQALQGLIGRGQTEGMNTLVLPDPPTPEELEELKRKQKEESQYIIGDIGGFNLGDAANAAWNGIVPIMANAALGPALAATENLGMDSAAQSLQNAAKSDLVQPKQYKSNNIFNDMISATTQSVPNLLAANAMARQFGPLAGALTMGTLTSGQMFGNNYMDLRNDGVAPDRAAGYAATEAGAEGAIDAVGVGKFLFPFLKNGAGRIANAIRGAATEGITEGIQAIPSNVLMPMAKGEDISGWDILMGVAHDILAGGAAGGVFGAIAPRQNQQANAQQSNAQKPNVQQKPDVTPPPANVSPIELSSAEDFLTAQSNTIDSSTDEGMAQVNSIETILANGTGEEKMALAQRLGWAPPSTSTAMQSMEFLINQGYTPEQAAGIAGGFMLESGGNSFDLDPLANNPSGAFGIGQWLKSRKDDLMNFAAERGLDPNDFNTQLQFTVHELQGKEQKAAQAIRDAKTVEDAALAADIHYERSEQTEAIQQQKVANAKRLLELWNQTHPDGKTRAQQVMAYLNDGNVQRDIDLSNDGSMTFGGEGNATNAAQNKTGGFILPVDEEVSQNNQTVNQTITNEDTAVVTPREFTGANSAPETRVVRDWDRVNKAPTETLIQDSELVERVTAAIDGDRGAQAWLHSTGMTGDTIRRLAKAISHERRLNRRESQNRAAQAQENIRGNRNELAPSQNEPPAIKIEDGPGPANIGRSGTLYTDSEGRRWNETNRTGSMPDVGGADTVIRQTGRPSQAVNQNTLDYPTGGANEPTYRGNGEAPARAGLVPQAPSPVAEASRIQTPDVPPALVQKAANNPTFVDLIQRADAGDVDAQQRLARLNPRPGLVDAVRNEIQERNNGETNQNNQGQDQAVQMEEPSRTEGEVQAQTSEEVKYGSQTTVYTDNNEPITVTYKLVEADNLITSQDPITLAPNDNYDQSMQPRDRERVAMQKQVNQISSHLNPELLGESQRLNEGAPIVNHDNMVENGNGRAISVVRAYKTPRLEEQAAGYKQYLEDNAEKFGFTQEDVANMREPVLVRERGEESNHLVNDIITSTAGGSRMGAVEQARTDAGKLTYRTLGLYVPNADGNIASPSNTDFMNAAIGDIANQNDLNALITADGRPSSEGTTRVRNALYAKAYDDGDMLARIAEDNSMESKRLAQATLAVAPKMAQIKGGIEAGTIDADLDAPSAVAQAVAIYNSAKERSGGNAENTRRILVAELYEQQTLMGDQPSDSVKMLAIAICDSVKKPGSTYRILNNLADNVLHSDDPAEGNMFPDVPNPTLEDYVRAAIEQEGNADTLISDTETQTQESQVDTRQEPQADTRQEPQTQEPQAQEPQVREPQTQEPQRQQAPNAEPQRETQDGRVVRPVDIVQPDDGESPENPPKMDVVTPAETVTETTTPTGTQTASPVMEESVGGFTVPEDMPEIPTNKSYKNKENHGTDGTYYSTLKNGQVAVIDGTPRKSTTVTDKDVQFNHRNNITIPLKDIIATAKQKGVSPTSKWQFLVKVLTPLVRNALNDSINKTIEKIEDPNLRAEAAKLQEAKYNGTVKPHESFGNFNQEVNDYADAVRDVFDQFLNDNPDIVDYLTPKQASAPQATDVAPKPAKKKIDLKNIWDSDALINKDAVRRTVEKAAEGDGASKAVMGIIEKLPSDKPAKKTPAPSRVNENPMDVWTSGAIINQGAVDDMLQKAAKGDPEAQRAVDAIMNLPSDKPAKKNNKNRVDTNVDSDTMKEAGRSAESEEADAGRLGSSEGPVGVRLPGGSKEGKGPGRTGERKTGSGETGVRQQSGSNGRTDKGTVQGRPREDGGRTQEKSVDSAGVHERGSKIPVISSTIDKLEEKVEKKDMADARDAARNDYTVKPSKPKSSAERAKDNINAIKLLKKIESEKRMATPAEQEELAKYSGWGGLSSELSKNWNTLHDILTEEEFFALQNTASDAYYTPPYVVSAMWNLARHLGFNHGRVLDPSTGAGIFFGMMPKDIRSASSLNGVELDSITGRIASQLYQSSNIQIKSFSDAAVPNNFYDLIITNVPFGRTPMTDPAYSKPRFKLHNYFFAKSIDKVRPGGLVMFITSTDTMDGRGNAKSLRTQLDKKAQLVGAIRLPSGVFKGSNTDVETDIIILRKLEAGEKSHNDWHGTTVIRADGAAREINGYFKKHPEMLIGHLTGASSRNGWTVVTSVTARNKADIDVDKALNRLIESFPENIFTPKKAVRNDSNRAARESIIVSGNNVGDIVTNNGLYGHIVFDKDGNKVFRSYAKKDQSKIKKYLEIENALNDLLQEQAKSDTTEEKLQKFRNKLNKAYDEFREAYGALHEKRNFNLIADAASSGRVLAIENYTRHSDGTGTSEKADIFTKRTVGTDKRINITTPSDALAASLQEEGHVDVKFMADALGQTEDAVVKNLGGAIIKDPATDSYVTRDEYLSGNVRQKLAIAEEAAKRDPSYKKNVEALKQVVPKDLMPSDISVELGATWIPASDVQKFLWDKLNVEPAERDWVTVTYNPADRTWKVKIDAANAKANAIQDRVYGTDNMSFDKLLEAVLNSRSLSVKAKVEKGNETATEAAIRDANNATAALNEKAKKLKDDFEKWLWEDPERRTRLLKAYNNTFNADVIRKYDGSFLTLPGFSETAPRLNPHQKNAIWRILNSRSTLLAHVVGAGKTWTMQAAGMELRRMGLARKVMYTVPNNMVNQFTKEFYQIYPNAKILVLTNEMLPDVLKQNKDNLDQPFTEEQLKKYAPNRAKRNATLQRIKMEDWDAIIVSHETFKRIPMSRESYANYYREQLAEYDAIAEEAGGYRKDEHGNEKGFRDPTYDSSNVAKRRKSLNEKLKRLENLNEKFDVGDDTFETLGIDQLFVDEADLFKNLEFPTNLSNVHGISHSGSQMSTDLHMKVRYLMSNPSTHGVVFATGTPLSNSIAELYTMCRYLGQDQLEAKGIHSFDDFAKLFLRVEDGVEPVANGNGYRIATMVKALKNAPEIKRIFRSFADIQMLEDLPQLAKERPQAERISVVVPETKWMKHFREVIIKDRSDRVHARAVDPTEDNMLKISTDFRKASLDPRLIDPTVPEAEANARIVALAEKVVQEYKDSSDRNGTQAIFSDLGKPKDKSVEDEGKKEDAESAEAISVYENIKKALVEMGIPADEIRFVHEAKTAEQKQELFEAVNEGRVRIIIGSTAKMGAGTNMQKKLVALHHFTTPWRPRDLEQWEGRILRRGNENKNVRIYNYGAKGSYDAIMWDKVRRKKSIIGDAMNGNLTERVVMDINEEEMSYAEMQSLCAGGELMREHVDAQRAFDKLRGAKSEWEREHQEMNYAVQNLPGDIDEYRQRMKNAEEDIKNRKGDKDAFFMTINGKTFDSRGKELNAEFEKMVNQATSLFNKDWAEGKTPFPMDIGTAGGFKIRLAPGARKNVIVQVVGYNVYEAATPSAVGAWNTIFSQPEAARKSASDHLKTAQTTLEQYQKLLKEPFPKQAELDEAQANLADVERRLQEEAEHGPSASEPEGTVKYSVTNRNLTPDTRVKVVDITNAIPLDLTRKGVFQYLRDWLYGKSFTIGKITASFKSKNDSRHFGRSSTPQKVRTHEIREKILSDNRLLAELIQNSVYVERSPSTTGHNGQPFVDFYAAVKNGEHIYRVLISAKDSNTKQGKFDVKDVGLYDFYPKGTSLKSKDYELKRSGSSTVPNIDAARRRTTPVVTVADLLRGVKGRDGKYLLNEDESLNLDPRLNMFSMDSGEESVRYSDDEMAEMVHMSHPNAQNWKRTETGVTFDTPDGRHWEYQFEDEIILTKEEREKANEDYGGVLTGDEKVQGRVFIADRKALVTLARDSEAGTADHEAFHVAMAGALTVKERAALRAYAKKNLKDAFSRSAQEEALADDYKDWQMERRGRQGSLVGRLYQKIEDFVYNTLDMLDSRLMRNERERRSIYKKLSEGEVFARKDLNESDKKVIDKMSIRGASAKYLEKTAAKLRGDIETPDHIHVQKTKGKGVDLELWKMLTTGSPSRSTNDGVRVLWRWARSAMDTQTRLERKWTKQHADILRTLKTDEDVEMLNALNWEGDATQHEFTDAELKARGVSDNVAKAYRDLRGLMKDIYTSLNDVRTMVHAETKNGVTEAQLAEMKKVKFFNILSTRENGDGTYNVTFNTPAYNRFTKNFTKEELGELRKQKDRVTILNVKSQPDGKISATVYMQAKPLANKEGYIPHIFHEQMIACRMLDKEASEKVQTITGLTEKKLSALRNTEGVTVKSVRKNGNLYDVDFQQDVYKMKVVGSAETLSEAVEKASKMESGNGEEYFISPKELLSDMSTSGVLVGDSEYDRIISNLMERNSYSLSEAREMVRGVVKTSNKHRFNSSFLHRKGAEGYEEDSRWVIQQHIRNSARYIAMEPFKYRALNLFERTYGAFNDSYDTFSWAGWSKGYINAIMNQPMALEKAVNGLLMKVPGFKERFSDPNHGRGSRALAGDITSLMSVAKLGVFNVSSALLNVFQLNNLPGFIGFKATAAGIRHALHPTADDKRILEAANVESDVGMDSVDGIRNLLFGSPVTGGKSFFGMYSFGNTKLERIGDYTTQLLGKTMFMFSATERFARRAAVLGAYWKARGEGMMEPQALEFARDVNDWVNFDYSVVDEPNIFRQSRGTIIGDMALQFRKFPIKQIGVMAEFVPGLGTTGRTKADMLKFWLPTIITSGLFGAFPAMDLLLEAWGGFDDDEDKEATLKKYIMEWAGNDPTKKKIAEAAMYGILAPTTGVDISRRVGMADVVPEYRGPASLFGPTGSTAAGLWRACQMSDPLYGVRQTAPALANIWTAAVGEARDSKGRVTQEFDSFQRLMKAAGFRTVAESVATDAKRISNAYKSNRANERARLKKEYLMDPSPENRQKLREAGLTPKQIRSMLKESKADSKARTRDGMTREERKELKGVLDFVG